MQQRFLAILIARLKLVFRDKMSLFFAFVFPVILVTVFGLLILGTRNISNIEVSVFTENKTGRTEVFVESMQKSVFKVTEVTDREQALQDLKDNKIRFLIEITDYPMFSSDKPVSVKTVYNTSSLNDYNQLVRPVLEGITANANYQGVAIVPKYEVVEGAAVGAKINQEAVIMNGFILQSLVLYSVIGAASTLSDEKQKNLLKRLGITRIKKIEFIIAYLISFLMIGFVQSAILISLATVAFGVQFQNLPLLLLTTVAVNIIFSFIGIFVGAVAKNANAANGLSNIISFPLVILSGAWFSITFLPKWVQEISKFSPITAARNLFDQISAVPSPEIGVLNIVILFIAMIFFLVLSIITLRFKRL